MKQRTVRHRRMRGHWPALIIVVFTLVFGASALAHVRYGIEVSVQKNVRKNDAYAVTVSGFAVKKEKAMLFVDYAPCGPTPATEIKRHDADLTYAVKGAFTKISGWKSRLTKPDHACAYLVDRQTGRVLATGSRTYPVQ